jgi:hypothetical protein
MASKDTDLEALSSTLYSRLFDGGRNKALQRYWETAIKPHLVNYFACSPLERDHIKNRINSTLHKKKDTYYGDTANEKIMRNIIECVHDWWNAIDRSPINIFYVLIRPNPKKGPAYEILLDRRPNPNGSFYWTLPNELTDRVKDERFEWIHLANASFDYRYLTYAAVKVVRFAEEESELLQHISPRNGEWHDIHAVIRGAQQGNPLYGQRIRGYVKGRILQFLNREHPVITRASSGAVAVPAALAKPHGVPRSVVVLIRQVSGRAYGEEYDVCMLRDDTNSYWTLPIVETAMLNREAWEWIVLDDRYTSTAALVIFHNIHTAPERIVPELGRYRDQLKWHNLKSFYRGAIGGSASYGRNISHHLTTSIMKHLGQNYPDLYNSLTFNPAVSDLGHMPMYSDLHFPKKPPAEPPSPSTPPAKFSPPAWLLKKFTGK